MDRLTQALNLNLSEDELLIARDPPYPLDSIPSALSRSTLRLQIKDLKEELEHLQLREEYEALKKQVSAARQRLNSLNPVSGKIAAK